MGGTSIVDQRRSRALPGILEDVPRGRYVDLGTVSGSTADSRKQVLKETAGMAYFKRSEEDVPRMAAYKRAIDVLAKGKVVVDIGAGSLARLAIMCARAGAAHVYAIEANPKAAASARDAVERAGLNETITVVEGYSMSLSELSQPADLIVHELMGAIASNEGVAVIAEDAKRFLKPGLRQAQQPWSIPAAVQTLVAPMVSHPDIRDVYLADNCWRWQNVLCIPDHLLLGDWQVCEDLAFDNLPPPAKEDEILSWEMKREAVFGGFVFCIRVYTLKEEEPFTSTPVGSTWCNIVTVFDDHKIMPGDTVSLRAQSKLESLTPTYQYHALLESASANASILPTTADFAASAYLRSKGLW